MLKGSMDIAILYGDRPVTGLDYKPLLQEHFHLVAPRSMFPEQVHSADISASELAEIDLLLPPRESFLRQAVERVCAEAGVRPRIVAEIQSQSTLSSAIAPGMSATVLPATTATVLPNFADLCLRRIDAPAASLQLSLCSPDNLGLSDAAFAVYHTLPPITPTTSSNPPAPSSHSPS